MDKSATMKWGVAAIAVIIVAAVAAWFSGVFSKAPPDEAEIAAFLEASAAPREGGNFELRIDDWTNLKNPEINGRTLHFDMVSLLDIEQLDKGYEGWEQSYMESRDYAAKKHVCQMEDGARMLAAGVVFTYTVLSKDGVEIGEVTAQDGFCEGFQP